ncbi:MAG: sigma-54 dependent transcriptional regulator [Hydrogenophaga sp.]|jgi:two-component system C4-dicarboxylate transport response regulator DctD|uniref:sigma-54-dependent transcriptional regulator n=1 Tax=Hydrogenophaga sp. TaxID=1904254 RepID=UPI0027260BF7|nr:sigma-54 dependent transcriptional regulator [Hydrogenophaga sp.]MDO9479126.1 sigma-54 dependent transcriptional regulator [Hydrogenophaga sp.]MDP3343960.1 sigma-54 dependent transcriptional regulator [Hydrogenophaga sp.]MDP3805069.1 sigma-54 dependent transcriptional regulator [Hydrogenophaga sp.]MDP3923812.1 sigma-54 dependent transcriptional regulator [Hydrogenophaga sp.]MDZ4237066.1 sigma-54 dependent transcriptional regulator [Hydrogenophaga sp.]
MNLTLTVLLVEDDAAMQLGCVQALQLADIPVRAFDSAEAVLPHIVPGLAGVVVTDMRLPGADGLSVICEARDIDPDLPVIMITGHGDVNLAVQAMRSGAYDFIPKPFSPEQLVEVVQRALEKRRLTLEVANLRRALSLSEGLEGQLVGHSPAIRRVRQLVMEVADSPVDVLIRGETGTGKEVVARALHEHSRRRKAPYVALNCGGLPDSLLDSELFGHEAGAFTGAQKRRIGRIEHAHGGTLFLDELESMPQGVQVKLLRVLQERSLERLGSNQSQSVDVRVVAATKDDLLERARQGSFRADLVYRLNVVNIELPPLRERRDDIPMLLEHFMLLAASRYGRQQPKIPQAQLRQLMARDWPGNVRELRNVADALVLGVGPQWVSPHGPAPDASHPEEQPTLTETVEQFERSLIADALQRHAGHVGQTAKALRIPKTTLVDKIKKHGLGKGEPAVDGY